MADRQSVIFFDGICNLCNGFVQLVLINEKHAHFQFCSLQSDYAKRFFIDQQFHNQHLDSIILFENNQFYIKSNAEFEIIKQLKWPYKALLVFNFLPKFFNDFMYDFMAKIRYRIFGKTNICWVMKGEWKERFL